MKTIRRGKHPNRSKLTIVELLRRQHHVQSAIPAKHQNCVVKLERIDSDTYRTENEITQRNGYEVRVRRRSELDEADDFQPAQKVIKIEYDDTSEGGPSLSDARTMIQGKIVPKSEVEIKMDIEDVNNRSDEMETNGSGEIVPSVDLTNPIKIEVTDVSVVPPQRTDNITQGNKRSNPKLSKNPKALKKKVTFTDKVVNSKSKNHVGQPNIPKEKKKNYNKLQKCSMCTYESINSSNFQMHVRSKHTGERPFKCQHCPSAYMDKRSLALHMVHHSVDLPFWCSKCNYRFARETALKWHIVRCVGKIAYECYLCKYVNIRRHCFLDHMKHNHFEGVPTMFPCRFCGKNFKRKDHLRVHMNTHTNQLKFNCSVCLEKFERKNEANSHEKTCKRRRFECYICKYTTPNLKNPRSLDQHMRTHTGNKSFCCTKCPREFALKRTLDVHLARHNGQKIFKCMHCGLQCLEARILSIHVQHCMNRKSFECYLCKRNLNLSFTALKLHMQNHLQPRRQYKCKFCPKTFIRKLGRKYHTISLHGDPEKLKCKHCNEQFTHFVSKVKHENGCKLQQAARGRTLIKCSHCPREFWFEHELRAHEMECVKRRRFQCYLCGKISGLSKIIVHMRSHTGERPAQCPHCPKNFRQNSHLPSHIKRYHKEYAKTPEQMYKCSICDRQFVEIHTQKNHEKRCKLFQCHLCGDTRKTWRKHCLDMHMRRFHTGVKRFQCSECPRAYLLRPELRRHSRRHLKELPFTCLTCGYKYERLNDLNRHEARCKKRNFKLLKQ